jgi:O-antigen/teichoic acid export membrane protein
LVSLVAGKELLTLFYQAEYAQHNDLLVWVMVAAAISYLSYFLGDALIAARYLSIQIPLFIGVTATSALMSYWLIPIHGLHGAAVALLVASIVQVVLRCAVMVYALYRLHRYTLTQQTQNV